MANNIRSIDVASTPGYIIIQRDSGPPQSYPISGLIRGEDIPVMTTSESVERIPPITKINDLIAILIKTLIEFQHIEDQFADDYDLEFIVDELEEMGVTW